MQQPKAYSLADNISFGIHRLMSPNKDENHKWKTASSEGEDAVEEEEDVSMLESDDNAEADRSR